MGSRTRKSGKPDRRSAEAMKLMLRRAGDQARAGLKSGRAKLVPVAGGGQQIVAAKADSEADWKRKRPEGWGRAVNALAEIDERMGELVRRATWPPGWPAGAEYAALLAERIPLWNIAHFDSGSRLCERCGVLFTLLDGRARFCSDACQAAAGKRRQRAQPKGRDALSRDRVSLEPLHSVLGSGANPEDRLDAFEQLAQAAEWARTHGYKPEN